jgi:tetraacyldisaccharide 4'-kinase
LGKNPVILKKFYKNHNDENSMIKANFRNFILNKSRIDGIKEAENKKFDIIVLDDGFQDYRFKKDLNILCFNSEQLIGNGLVLPSGPLRESLDSIKRAHIILINGHKNLEFEKKILDKNDSLDIFYSYYKPVNIEDFRNKKLLAIAGIGNPENFFKLLEVNNLDLIEKMVFPDHHKFTKIEIQNILNKAKKRDLNIIMTEKDYYKIEHFKIEHVNYLKVSLEIENKTEFLKKIKKLYV